MNFITLTVRGEAKLELIPYKTQLNLSNIFGFLIFPDDDFYNNNLFGFEYWSDGDDSHSCIYIEDSQVRILEAFLNNHGSKVNLL